MDTAFFQERRGAMRRAPPPLHIHLRPSRWLFIGIYMIYFLLILSFLADCFGPDASFSHVPAPFIALLTLWSVTAVCLGHFFVFAFFGSHAIYTQLRFDARQGWQVLDKTYGWHKIKLLSPGYRSRYVLILRMMLENHKKRALVILPDTVSPYFFKRLCIYLLEERYYL